jgi:hypothetical protein
VSRCEAALLLLHSACEAQRYIAANAMVFPMPRD